MTILEGRGRRLVAIVVSNEGVEAVNNHFFVSCHHFVVSIYYSLGITTKKSFSVLLGID
jgi:hypothetical protein